MRDLRQILRSGYVQRWHANPDMAHTCETLAHHHCQVAQIILAVHPAPSLTLIDAALHHDCGEMGLGDVSQRAKRESTMLQSLLEIFEARNRRAMGLEWRLTDDEKRWLKFADRLAAYAFMLQRAPHLANGDGWPEDRAWILNEANRLGVYDRLAGVL